MLEFKKNVFDRLTARLNLKSAAFLGKDDLSLFAHGHNFSDVDFFPSYGPQSDNGVYNLVESCDFLGNIDIKKFGFGESSISNSISVYIKKYTETIRDEAAKYKRFEVGQLEFFGAQNMRTYLTNILGQSIISYNGRENIDIFSENFRGFVVPNNTTFTCARNEFREACRIFAGNPDATSFTVPRLDGFFRANNNTDSTLDNNEIQSVGFFNALADHGHSMPNTTAGGAQTVTVKLPNLLIQSAADQSATNNVFESHNVSTSVCNCWVPIKITNLTITSTSINNLQCGNAIGATVDQEAYPPYIEIPALIYIGERFEQENTDD